MVRTLKWIYELGVRHERRRVRLLIAGYRRNKPERPDGDDKMYTRPYENDLSVYYEVTETLERLLRPDYSKTTKIERPSIPLEDL